MRWEYRVLTSGGTLLRKVPEDWLTEHLNQLGGEGWELVSTFTTSLTGNTNSIVSILKRPRA
jgi:hypothetical protein